MRFVGSREIDVKLQRFSWHRESDNPTGIEDFGSFSHRKDHLTANIVEKLAVPLAFGFADEKKLAGP